MAPTTSADRRVRQKERLVMIRLRVAIDRELHERGITAPAAIAAALDLPEAEVNGLLFRKQHREGDLARLHAVAARLGLSEA